MTSRSPALSRWSARVVPGLVVISAFVSSVRADHWVYVSVSKDQRITQLRLDEKRGELEEVGRFSIDGEPAGLVLHPSRKILFAAVRSRGQIASFAWDPRTGSLSPVGVIDAAADPAFLTIDGTERFLLSAYYQAGRVAVHRIADDGTLTDHQWLDTAEKAHCIRLDATNRFALVPHTGPNEIWQFRFDGRTGRLSTNTPDRISADPGEEPRHVVFHPALQVVYAVNERGDSVAMYAFDARHGTIRQEQKLSTLPAGFDGNNACADLELTPDHRFLYASNRGHDSLAAYRVDRVTGRLTSIGQFKTETTPRQFSITPDGRFLIAAGQGNGYLKVFRIESTGALQAVSRYEIGRAPWWVLSVRAGD